jgi:putative transposase
MAVGHVCNVTEFATRGCGGLKTRPTAVGHVCNVTEFAMRGCGGLETRPTGENVNFRRYYVPHSIVFITQVVHGRMPVFAEAERLALLLDIVREVKKLHPFHMLAYVFLWEHFHLLVKPDMGVTHSEIMHSIKLNYTKQYKTALAIQGSMRFWQPRYWDHVIRDEDDFAFHMDYIHYNPVKHGVAARPEDWPHSSFSYWKQRGDYPDRWGWTLPASLRECDGREME